MCTCRRWNTSELARFAAGVWPAPFNLPLRRGEPYILVKKFGTIVSGMDALIVGWTTTTMAQMRQHLLEELACQLADHSTRSVAWHPPDTPPSSIADNAFDLLAGVFADASCRFGGVDSAQPWQHGQIAVPLVITTTRKRGRDGALVESTSAPKRLLPSLFVELERHPPAGEPASVIAMRVAFPLAPSIVRLTRQVLSLSLAPGEGRIVVDVQANTRVVDDTVDNAVASVGFTRNSVLGDVAVTRDSVLTSDMLRCCAHLDDLPDWVAQQGQCDLVECQLQSYGGAQDPVVVNEGHADFFEEHEFIG